MIDEKVNRVDIEDAKQWSNSTRPLANTGSFITLQAGTVVQDFSGYAEVVDALSFYDVE